jgi:NAD/NADP transhydrogenase beta subunit
VIRGRPTNLWLGLITALFGAIGVTLVAAGFDPTVVATLLSAYTGVAGASIALIAGGTPVVAPGTDIKVQTPSGQPNATATVDLAPSGEVTVS